ncbi:MAG: MBL fold metallo-hydrolase, partial [Solirubrobacteraceae bacterium]
AQRRARRIVNARTRLHRGFSGGAPRAVAAGVWVLRGWFPRVMNVYLIEDQDGVTVFDAGVSAMTGAIRGAAVHLGGIRRVVLGHADCDVRGAAAGLGAPVYCHALERSAAQAPSPFRDYWNLDLLPRSRRSLYPLLMSAWDGGGLEPAGTVSEDDQIAGFRVVHLPGHAPGQIGLFREEDRLALVSDCFFRIDAGSGRRIEARVPHPAFNQDTQQARESIRKLAALRPQVAWPAHGRPASGEDIDLQLQRAASAAV